MILIKDKRKHLLDKTKSIATSEEIVLSEQGIQRGKAWEKSFFCSEDHINLYDNFTEVLYNIESHCTLLLLHSRRPKLYTIAIGLSQCINL